MVWGCSRPVWEPCIDSYDHFGESKDDHWLSYTRHEFHVSSKMWPLMIQINQLMGDHQLVDTLVDHVMFPAVTVSGFWST